MHGFEAAFGRAPTFHAEACGRVNLIGEHTDYNDGFVLPTAIPQKTRVALAQRDDQQVRLYAENVPEKRFTYRLGEEQKTGGWADYVQGATKLLREEGIALCGFDAWIDSDVPIGSGLSSSAALGVALLRVLETTVELRSDAVTLAKRCQRIENEFVGARVGIMDPLAAAVAEPGKALFVDTRTLAYEQVPLPMHQMDLLVVNSGVVHRNAGGGGYNRRRAECEAACERLGVKSLRDVSLSDRERIDALPHPLSGRARHVITENARVLSAVQALREGDLPALGALLVASHDSLKNDYEVSVPEIDFLVERANKDSRVFGVRITGGGFGGSIVALTQKGSAREVAENLCSAYVKVFPVQPTVLVG